MKFSIVHSPTTFRKPIWFRIGSVFTWHMYHPLSDSLTSFIRSTHLRPSTCVIVIRWFLVITCVCIVKIVWVSTRSQATCVTINRVKQSSSIDFLLLALVEVVLTLYVCRLSITQIRTASLPKATVRFWIGSPNFGKSRKERGTNEMFRSRGGLHFSLLIRVDSPFNNCYD